MIKKALAVMLVVCVASSSAIGYNDSGDWWLFGIGLAATVGGGVMLGVGWETHDTGFERIKGNPDTFVKTGEETKMTTVGVSGIAVAFIGLAVAGIAYFLQPFKDKGVEVREYTAPPDVYAPPPVIDPIVNIPLFDLPSGSVGGGVEFGLPKVEGLRLSLSVADAGAYALAR
jgi:hypothetical protein